jgi:hypothetical protein
MNDSARLEPVPVDAHEGLLALFDAAPVVALGEAHWLDQQHRLIRELLLDERFAETVDAVVVAFGNARHQPLIDRYLAGDDFPPSQLRRVWSECVGGWFSRVFESRSTQSSSRRCALSGSLAAWNARGCFSAIHRSTRWTVLAPWSGRSVNVTSTREVLARPPSAAD